MRLPWTTTRDVHSAFSFFVSRYQRAGFSRADKLSLCGSRTAGSRLRARYNVMIATGDALAVPFYGEHDLTAREAVQAFHFAGMILDALGHELTRPRQRADHKR